MVPQVSPLFFLKEQPSVRRALPPVGLHSRAEQLLHTTTVWLWLKTVVLRKTQKRVGKATRSNAVRLLQRMQTGFFRDDCQDS